jgi:hypothetical protein
MSKIETVAPASWSMEDTFESCALAAELLSSDAHKIDARARGEANGCFDVGERNRRHRIYDRAEMLAESWRSGDRFALMVQAVRTAEDDQTEIAADAMREIYR